MSNNAGALILVLEDVEETRDGIEQLLNADGYRIDPARDEEDGVTRAMRERPCLILVSLGGADADIIQIAARIRLRAGLMEDIARKQIASLLTLCPDWDVICRKAGGCREP